MEKFITAALCGITIVIAQRKKRLFSLLMFTLCFFHPSSLLAQDDMKVEAYDTTHQEEENKYKNETGGEFTPGRGFDVFKSKMASLNISIYGLIRFTNQLPDSQTFTDHLGRIRPVDTRRDLQWHRTF